MSTLFLLYGGVLVILSVALVPTYVLIGAQIKTSVLEARKLGEEDATFAAADIEVRMAKEVISQLNTSPQGTTPLTSVVKEVRSLAPDGVQFKNFVVVEEAGVVKVHVQGQASTREELASFKNKLQESALFENAEVPIADLARDVDLPFTVTVTLALNTDV